MRILFTSIRGTGHFNPLVPLARGLADRRHEVRFAGIAEMAERIEAAGFVHTVIGGPTEAERAEIDAVTSALPREKIGEWYVPNMFMGLLPRAGLANLLASFEDWRPDLILHESCEFAGPVAAELAGIPSARIEVVNGESEESIASNYAHATDALRVFAGLAPDGGAAHRAEATFSAHPAALDDTPRVNSRPPLRYLTTPLAHQGATATPDWHVRPDLPLVYATFGTVTGDLERVRHVYQAALDALGALPVSALLTIGKDCPADAITHVPPNVAVRAFVPQAEVLQHACLMLCHGGSGTVLGALAAGAPLVVLPLFADQPENARCLLGSGLAVTLPGPEIDDLAGRLRAAVETALADPGLRARAAAAATEVAAMATPDDLFEAFEAMASAPAQTPGSHSPAV